MREFLTEEPEFIVCGEAVDGNNAIEQARELRPDLIILDASMPVLNGIQAAPLLKKLLPSALIILFTAHEFMMRGLHATDMGVDAVVAKDCGMAALGESINTLLHTTVERKSLPNLYRTWLSPQAFVWKKAFRTEKLTAAGKFNSAGIRSPCISQRRKGEAPSGINGLKRPEDSLETL